MKSLHFLLFAIIQYTSAAHFEWSAHQLPEATQPITEVVFADGRFVGIGPRMTLYSSVDGKSWSAGLITSASGFSHDSFYNLTGLTYGNGVWIAVGTKIANPIILSSNDGINWLASEPVNLPRPEAVTFFDGVFYATDISDDGVHTSLDGVSWQKVLSTPFNPSVLVGSPVGFAIALSGGAMSYSASLLSLSATVLQTPSASAFRHVGYHNGRFMATDEFRQLYISYDGIIWETVTSPFPLFHEVRGLVYTSAGYIAATWKSSTTEGYILQSDDGVSWNNEVGANISFYSLAYGNGTLVAGAKSGIVVTGTPKASQIKKNQDGSFSISFPAVAGVPAIIETTGNLTADNWNELERDTPKTNSFSTTQQNSSESQFYRLRQ